jgi:hypothetical protein
MRKWLILVLLGLMVYPSAVGAQGGTKLKSVNVELWPEYDQPSMLVIHEFVVDPSTALPVQILMRFPKGANLTAVAYFENSLINAEFSGPEEQGIWQTVVLNVKSYAPHRIEYYQPITRDGNKRDFSFRWLGDYAADEFHVTVQLPADSTTVVTEPPLISTVISEDGLHLVGIVNSNNVKMGQAYQFKLAYEREAETLTNPANGSNVQPAEPINSDTEGRVSIDNLPWIIGSLGLTLIGLALFFYRRSTQTSEKKSRRRHRSGRTEDGEQAYCHECGARANASDRFCRTCGSKLRLE